MSTVQTVKVVYTCDRCGDKTDDRFHHKDAWANLFLPNPGPKRRRRALDYCPTCTTALKDWLGVTDEQPKRQRGTISTGLK